MVRVRVRATWGGPMRFIVCMLCAETCLCSPPYPHWVPTWPLARLAACPAVSPTLPAVPRLAGAACRACVWCRPSRGATTPWPSRMTGLCTRGGSMTGGSWGGRGRWALAGWGLVGGTLGKQQLRMDGQQLCPCYYAAAAAGMGTFHNGCPM